MSTSIENLVHKHYWVYDDNCAITAMNILSNYFDFKINKQVIDALTGMNGTGKHGAQCGLVEGTLSFIGIIGKYKNLPNNKIESLCNDFAQYFEDKKGSIICRYLRPQGFSKDNPPHLCEKLTVDTIQLSIDFIKNQGILV